MRYLKALPALFLMSFLSAQTEGDVFFGTSNIHEIRFTFNQVSYWDSLTDGYTNDYYIKGDVEIDGTLMTDCGVKFKGNSSYNNPSVKKSFKIDMNEYVSGQDYDGLKKLNLNNCFKDPTFLREKLMNDFLRDHGLYAPRVHYANVYINNTLWGLYTTVEEVDVKLFLRNNIGNDNGNLFKGDPTGDLKWLGSAASSYYAKYELKTNTTANDWTDLVNFINVINNTPAANLPAALDTVFDVDNYIHTWAVHTLFSNLDSYMGSGHNYFIYHDSTDNKFKWITWDVNEAFGNFSQGMSVTQMENMSIFYLPSPATSRPLNNNMLQVASYEQALADAVCEYTLYDFSSAALDPVIDSLANLIRTSVYADPNKFFSDVNFEDNLEGTVVIPGMPPSGGSFPGLKSFIANKRIAATGELVTYGCYVGINESETLTANIYPNPTTDFIIINGLDNINDYSITIYDQTGKPLLKKDLQSNTVSLEEINATGILVIEIRQVSTGNKKIMKLIKY
jgi:hypothetical protein